jgi:hypothetical protein
MKSRAFSKFNKNQPHPCPPQDWGGQELSKMGLFGRMRPNKPIFDEIPPSPFSEKGARGMGQMIDQDYEITLP